VEIISVSPVSSSIKFKDQLKNGKNLDLYWMEVSLPSSRRSLTPLSRNDEVNVPKKYPRIEGGMDGHYWQFIDACIAGYGNASVESPFQGYAGPLTETVLMGNLLLRSFNIREKIVRQDPVYGEMEGYVFPGRYINYKWDGDNMKITNFEQANQFVKREYREGWGKLEL